jgi:hypothetical protein
MDGLVPVLLAVVFGLCLVVMRRNSRVHAYRMRLLGDLHEAALADIATGRPWEWRYRAFEAVSYDRMVLTFWRPLTSFYRDRSFTDPGATPVNGG